jgi:hypothetical protein
MLPCPASSLLLENTVLERNKIPFRNNNFLAEAKGLALNMKTNSTLQIPPQLRFQI